MKESKIVKIIEAESRVVVAKGWGKGEVGLLKAHKILVTQDEYVLEIYCRDCN